MFVKMFMFTVYFCACNRYRITLASICLHFSTGYTCPHTVKETFYMHGITLFLWYFRWLYKCKNNTSLYLTEHLILGIGGFFFHADQVIFFPYRIKTRIFIWKEVQLPKCGPQYVFTPDAGQILKKNQGQKTFF